MSIHPSKILKKSSLKRVGYVKNKLGQWVKTKKKSRLSSSNDQDDIPLPSPFDMPTEDVPPSSSPFLRSLSHHIGESSHSHDDTVVHGITSLKTEVDTIRHEMREIYDRQDEAVVQMTHMMQLLKVILSCLLPPALSSSSSLPLAP